MLGLAPFDEFWLPFRKVHEIYGTYLYDDGAPGAASMLRCCWVEEILHQLIWITSHDLQGFNTSQGGCLGFLNHQQ